ncbi:hypothetical protein FN846DRAFT_548229 [Sphaerosporella brunnea]|uniref:Uncharacterized protein n=1 Tax=Sphaerosporella brunnea TaxID=1250544 RepID=A0A5J5ECG8_9PEZI|nr:hypothetical protein FN846DRAFT_548229 [Sphaerosporella brunnea]
MRTYSNGKYPVTNFATNFQPWLTPCSLEANQFVRLAALVIRHEALKLDALPPDTEILLFSEAYLDTITSMLRQANLYQTIAQAGFQILDTFPHVLSTFAGPEGFLGAFISLADVVYRRASSQPKLSSQLGHLHGLPLLILRDLQILPTTSSEARGKILFHATEFWTILEAAISNVLDSHIQVVDIKELVNRLDMFGQLGAVLYALQPTNLTISLKLRPYLSSNSLGILKVKDASQIVDWANKFPFYFKMLCTSRMDVRLKGLTCMTDTLLAVWGEYRSHPIEGEPILGFLVDFLIENKVLEYIVGPESHSELINRSGNVPAFLIVNRKITEHLMDCLWQPVLDNKDPRIVKATLKMHQEMMTTMTTDHLYSLSRRVSRVPFTSFDSVLMHFVGHLVDRTSKAYSPEPRQRGDMESARLGPAPYEMLIRLMRLSSEHDDTTQSLEIFEKSNEQLTALAEFGPEDSARRRILEHCVEDIRVMNASVTGSYSVILAFLRRRPRNHRSGSPTALDIEYLVGKFDFAALVVRELVEFIDSHRTDKAISRLRKLKIRLELLSVILRLLPGSLSKGSHAQLWSYVVGEKSLGSSERNVGFDFYHGLGSSDTLSVYFDLDTSAGLYLTGGQETHPILDGIYREFFPALDCTDISFSPSMIDLCSRSLEYLNRGTQPQDHLNAHDNILHIFGCDQLWRIILSTRDEKLASATIDILVQAYLDCPRGHRSDTCQYH